MLRSFVPRRAWPFLGIIAIATLALAAGCKGHYHPLAAPTSGGGDVSASINASATSGRAPLDVVFTSDVHGGNGAYQYLWSFGDGRTSTAASPRVQFPSGGTFDVTLKVTSGENSVTTPALTLHFDSDVQLSCSADPEEAIAPATVSFRSDARGGNGSFSYRWDFGDGSTSTALAATHSYDAPGTYRAVLTATSGGSSAVCRQVVTLYGTFHLTACRATPAGGTAVQFHAIPSFCLFNECTYAWDFGGAGSGTGTLTARPFFTYAAPGTYAASLAATTDNRHQSAACKVTVTVP